ncbi:MAG: ABC transporter substrate-binding protein [Syntrophus sp. (in: bacteria)]|nr:ABC transporter substrate-binding protein [Syntrophus sp. (in: bacteria)]
MKKKKILIAGIIIVIGIIIYLIIGLKKDRNDGSMRLSGNVEVTEANIGFKTTGRVVQLLVDEGSNVKAGELLARLDNAEIAALVAQNKAALKEAATRLQELKAGSRSQEIEQARASVNAQEAELKRVRQEYERADILYRNGAISTSQFDVAKSTYDSRIALHKNARETLSLVREGPRKEDITIAEHRVEQSRAILAASEERFKDTAIYASVAGIVLRKNVELGETVAPGVPVFTIGDLENPWIKVYVKEDKLGLVKLGQKATITVDTYKGKSYEGTISYIASEAEFTPKTVQTQEERVKLVFAVKVRVKNEKGELKPGMPADVKITIRP